MEKKNKMFVCQICKQEVEKVDLLDHMMKSHTKSEMLGFIGRFGGEFVRKKTK